MQIDHWLTHVRLGVGSAVALSLASACGSNGGLENDDTDPSMPSASSGSEGSTGPSTPSDPTTSSTGSTSVDSQTSDLSTSGGESESSTGSTSASESTGHDSGSSDTGDPPGSMGCGRAPHDSAGGVNVVIDAGPDGDGMRQFFLSLPPNYDPSTPHSLIFGYPGTNWRGEMVAPYLQLESDAVSPSDDEIFIYPDPLWRDFEGWGNLGGWVLGPHASPAQGNQDLVFTEAILDYMEEHYCIDPGQVFATGHSWGGDMAHVVSCFLGDRFTASVPVAANAPYWFNDNGTMIDCIGQTAVWTMYGQNDTHFGGSQTQGLECRDFWLDERQCDGAAAITELNLGDAADECVEYQGCSATTRFCLYGAQFGHQIPSTYFAEATMAFFRSF